MKTQPESNALRVSRTPGGIGRWLRLMVMLIPLLACQPTSLFAPKGTGATPTPPSVLPTSANGLSKPGNSSQLAAGASVLITDIQGGVRIYTSPGATVTPAVLGQVLPVGASIQTEANGQATLLFPDGSIIRVAGSTTFQLQGIGNAASNPDSAIRLDLGTLFIFVNAALGQKVFDVQTPAGVASVRGSYMRVDYYPESVTVILTCLETHATCNLVDDTDGITLIMTNGKRGIIIFGQPFGQVEGMTDRDLEDFLTAIPQAIQVVPTVFPRGTPTPGLSRTPLPSATPTTACVPTTLPCPTAAP